MLIFMLPLHIVQEKLLGELSLDMETTTNRLDFVQVSFVLSALAQFAFVRRPCPLRLIFLSVQHTYYEISFLTMYYPVTITKLAEYDSLAFF